MLPTNYFLIFPPLKILSPLFWQPLSPLFSTPLTLIPHLRPVPPHISSIFDTPHTQHIYIYSHIAHLHLLSHSIFFSSQHSYHSIPYCPIVWLLIPNTFIPSSFISFHPSPNLFIYNLFSSHSQKITFFPLSSSITMSPLSSSLPHFPFHLRLYNYCLCILYLKISKPCNARAPAATQLYR